MSKRARTRAQTHAHKETKWQMLHEPLGRGVGEGRPSRFVRRSRWGGRMRTGEGRGVVHGMTRTKLPHEAGYVPSQVPRSHCLSSRGEHYSQAGCPTIRTILICYFSYRPNRRHRSHSRQFWVRNHSTLVWWAQLLREPKNWLWSQLMFGILT